MPLRIIAVIFLALTAAIAPAASAKEKKMPAKPARTWKTLVDHVIKHGGEDSIEGSTAKTLGYESDVKAKSLGLEPENSKDNRDHSIFIVYAPDKGSLTPKEIVLGIILVKEAGSIKEIDSYRVRMKLDGSLIKGMHATGIVGHVNQQALSADSKELQSIYKQERDLYLRDVDMSKLVQ